MSTAPLEPGSDPDITPGGDPNEPLDPVAPGTVPDPEETENPD
jgi:hypothetical protein